MTVDHIEHLKTCWHCNVNARIRLFFEAVVGLFQDLALQIEVQTLLLEQVSSNLKAAETELTSTIENIYAMAPQAKNGGAKWTKIKHQRLQDRLAAYYKSISKPTIDRVLLLEEQVGASRKRAADRLQVFRTEPNELLVPPVVSEFPQHGQHATPVEIALGVVFKRSVHLSMERYVAAEHMTFAAAVLDDLIYVVESLKPNDVDVSPIDGGRLRRLVRDTVQLVGVPVPSELVEWGILVDEFSSDTKRFRKHQIKHRLSKPDFAGTLSIVLNMTDQTIARSVPKCKHLNPVHLSPALWSLLKELLSAGKHGTTKQALAEKLDTSEGAISTRKNQLKQKLFALKLTIPGDGFRLENCG